MLSLLGIGDGGIVDALAFGVLLVAVASFVATKASRDKYAGVNLPPGDTGLPFLGNALEMARGMTRFADGRPALSMMSFLGTKAVLVKDAKMAEKVIRGEGRLVEQNVAWLPGIAGTFGEKNITMVQGEKHKRLRAMMMPAFSTATLQHAFKLQQKIMRKHLAQWTESLSFDGSTGSHHVAADFGAAFIGIDVVSDNDAGKRVIDLVADMTRAGAGLPINIPGIPTLYRKGKVAREELYESLIRPILNDRRENPLVGEAAKADLATVLLNARYEDGSAMDQQSLEENMVTLVFASMDTTFTTFLHFLITVCTYPEVQDKIRAEVRTVFGDRFREEGDDVPTSVLDELEYLDQVMKELSRMYPVLAGLFFRRAKVDFQLGDYTIPKGMYLRLSSPHIQNDPQVWTDPEEFDPSRWAPDGEGWQNKKMVIDFGFGSRQCLGKRLAEREKLLFAAFLLRDHKVEFATGEPPTMGPYLPFQRIVGDFPIKLTPVE